MSQQVNLKLKGLYTAPNDFSGVPDGALEVADNIVIDNENLAESRRGFTSLTDSEFGAQITRLGKYQGYRIGHGSTTLAWYNPLSVSPSKWTAYSGSYASPDTSMARTRFLEASQNFYFNTSKGVYKLDVYSGTPALAGVPQGLDVALSLTGSSGFFGTNVEVEVTGTTTSGSANLTLLSDVSGIQEGMYVSGTGITAGTTVSSVTESVEVASGSVTTAIGSTTISAINTTTGFEAALVAGQFIEGTGILPGTRIVSVNTGAHTAVISRAAVAAGTITATVSSDPVVTMSANATASGTVTISFSDGSQVGYRIIFGIRDANNNIIYGAPSQFTSITNTTGATRDVQLVFTIPSGITTSHFYQIYRTAQTASAAVSPIDDEQLVYEGNPSSGDISAGYVTVTDSTPDSLKGQYLYTSVSQEGISQANEQPPFCKDFCNFGPYTVYANIKTKQKLKLTIIAVGGSNGIALNDTLTIAGVTYTAKSSETIASGYYQLVTSGTPAQNIADTTNSLIKVINRYASNTLVYAILLSGPTDTPGQILIIERGFGGNSFAATASAHGSAFSPSLPTSGTTISSSQDVYKNGLLISKENQPEAVPLANLLFAGNASKEIRRVIALREYVVILKDDGIFRLTGTTIDTMSIAPFDLTTKLIAPESAISLSNEVWGYFDQGVCSVSDTGVNVRSRPIENTLRALNGSSLSAIKSYAFGVGYETDRKYVLAMVSGPAETYATQEFIYNTFTNAWTRWTRSCSTGYVDQDEDILYLANCPDNNVSYERKSNTFRDYVDEAFDVTITAVNSYVLTLNSVSGIEVGDVIQRSTNVYSVIVEVDTLAVTVTVSNLVGFTTGAAEILPAIENIIQWKPVVAGNPAFLRQYSEGIAIFKRTRFNEATISFATDISQSFQDVEMTGFSNGDWGLFAWGSQPWGGLNRSRSVRFLVPQDKQMASLMNVQLTIRNGYSFWASEGLSMSFYEVSQEINS